MNQHIQDPGVRFPPPILFALGIAAGWLLNRVVPLPISAVIPRAACLVVGWAAILAGGTVLAWALLTFVQARTAIYPNQPARAVVAGGPYRYSRNPMYVGLAAVMAGVGLVADTAWVVGFIPLVLLALTALVIRREEAYLSAAFGEDYAGYRARVRRWL